jgi:hypothetical protein
MEDEVEAVPDLQFQNRTQPAYIKPRQVPYFEGDGPAVKVFRKKGDTRFERGKLIHTPHRQRRRGKNPSIRCT